MAVHSYVVLVAAGFGALLLSGCTDEPSPTAEAAVPGTSERLVERGTWTFLAPAGDPALRITMGPGERCEVDVASSASAEGTIHSIHWDGASGRAVPAYYLDGAVGVNGATFAPASTARSTLAGPGIYGHIDHVAGDAEADIYLFSNVTPGGDPNLGGGNLQVVIECDAPRPYSVEFAESRLLQAGAWDTGVQGAGPVGPWFTTDTEARFSALLPMEVWGLGNGNVNVVLEGGNEQHHVSLRDGLVLAGLAPDEYTLHMDATLHLGQHALALMPFGAPGGFEDGPWELVKQG